MTLQQMQPFTFSHSDQQDAIYTQYTAQQIKALFDSRGDELRTALNLLILALSSTNGASNIGINSVTDLDGTNVQSMLQSMRDKLKSKIDGSSGADFVNATAIPGITGETVQSILESLKTYIDIVTGTNTTSLDTHKSSSDHDSRYYVKSEIDLQVSNLSTADVNNANNLNTHKSSSDHDSRYFTKDQMQSITAGASGADLIKATPIAANSGNTVQAQLAWLLSQIAIAATGSIPDGSISEVKLAQALVDKINTSLSNTGVLTTLLTIDKSSLVNALNENVTNLATLQQEFTTHLDDYTKYKLNIANTLAMGGMI